MDWRLVVILLLLAILILIFWEVWDTISLRRKIRQAQEEARAAELEWFNVMADLQRLRERHP